MSDDIVVEGPITATLKGQPMSFAEFVMGYADFMSVNISGQLIPDEKLETLRQALVEAQNRLDILSAYSEPDWERAATLERREIVISKQRRLDAIPAMRRYLETRIRQVEAWQPGGGVFASLKSEMLSDLRQVLDTDANPDLFQLPDGEVDVSAYKNRRLSEARSKVGSCNFEYRLAVERNARRKAWLEELRRSLSEHMGDSDD